MPTATAVHNIGISQTTNLDGAGGLHKRKLLENGQSSDNDQDHVKPDQQKPEKSSAEIYEKVLKDGPFVIGDENPLTPVDNDNVSWLDTNKINLAMELFYEYFAMYAITTIMIMMALAVSVKPISTLIFCNNKPMKPDEYFRRFLGKFRGTEKFFTVFKEPEEIRKVFYKTRKLHTMAVSRLNKLAQGKPIPEVMVWKEEQWMRDFVQAVKKDAATIPRNPDHPPMPPHIRDNLSWDTQLPFNQFAMVYFTAAFFGSVWRRPDLYNIKDKNDPKMLAFIHMWAVIAKMLGLQDEYNIYINPDHNLIDRVVTDVYVHSLDNIDTCVVYLQGMVGQGIFDRVPLVTHKEALCFAMIGLGCKSTDNLWKLMDLKDKVMFWAFQAIFWAACNYAWFRHFTNWLLRRIVYNLYKAVLDKPVEKYQLKSMMQ